MTDSNARRITLLPSEPLPPDAPEPKLKDKEHVEVYSLGDARAVIIVREADGETSIRPHWLSAQDGELAVQLLTTMRQRQSTSGKKILLRLEADQKALMGALGGQPPISEIMEKAVDSFVSIPPDVKYRPLSAEEAKSYLEEVKEDYTKTLCENMPDLSHDRASEMAAETFTRALPEGPSTPGHSFLVIQEAAAEEETVGYIWICLDEATKKSFCYKIEVVPQKRRQGYGRKTLLVWEHAAAEAGAQLLGLNVFGKNTAARNLYHGAAFAVKQAVYAIEE
jgi:ribosomal protein S18 acetylase RimI-like enzyme